MKGQLVGADDLKARLRSMGQSFKPMGKDWAHTVAEQSARNAPRGKTGKLARSFKVRSATARRAIVDAIWYAKFPNKGTKAHVIKDVASGALSSARAETRSSPSGSSTPAVAAPSSCSRRRIVACVSTSQSRHSSTPGTAEHDASCRHAGGCH